MKLHHVVFKDIARRKKRVLYAALGVIIATMTVVGVLTIALAGRARIYSQLEKYGANLSIVPATKSLDTGLGDLTLGSVTIGDNYIQESVVADIQRIADTEIKRALKNVVQEGKIATVAPQLLLQTEIKNTALIVAGIRPQEEITIKTWWKIAEGKYLSSANEAIIGWTVASVLQLKVGDTLSLNGTDVTVAGILEETGAGDDYRVFVPLQTLQTVFGKQGLLTTIDVRALCNACPVEIIADAINKEVPGLRAVAVKQVAATEMGMLDKINKLMMALGGVTLVVGGFGVVNTLMTSVHERVKDIGIMKAVGASRRQIITAFVYEAIVIGIIGGLVGYGAGTVLAYILGPLIFEGTTISFVPLYIPLALALAILIAVGATLYPAFHATRIKIAECFRSL